MPEGLVIRFRQFARWSLVVTGMAIGLLVVVELLREAAEPARHASAAMPTFSNRPSGPQPGYAYPVFCRQEKGEVVLEFAGTGRPEYLAVVGTLGSGTGRFALQASLQNAEHSEFPARLTALPVLSPSAGFGPVAQLVPASPHPLPDPPPSWLIRPPLDKEEVELVSLQRPVAADSRDVRVFHIHVTNGPLSDPAQYAAVVGRRIAVGKLVDVFLDAQQNWSEIDLQLPGAVISSLETRIGPGLAQSLGSCHDINGDQRFTVLLTPWLSRLQGGTTRLKGFVRSTDFSPHGPAPFSNRCDMLYLNSDLRPGAELDALIAHELTHAVALCERRTQFDRLGFIPEDDWLNEAIAHLSENLHSSDWQNLDHRIEEYLRAPERYPLVVADYYQAGLWRNHGCRGATYLFLRWCVDTFGEELLGQLVRSRQVGTGNVAQATQLPFDELFRRWTLATAVSRRSLSVGMVLPAKPGLPETARLPSATGLGVNPYRSLDLTQQVGRYRLAGPSTVTLQPDGTMQQWEQRGTSARFFSLQSSQSGRYRFEVAAETDSRLQITLIPLPPNDGRTPSAARISGLGQAN